MDQHSLLTETDPGDETPAIGAIVLAAGRSTRMGGNHKLLLPLADRPLVSYAVDAASASSADVVIVVLGYQAEQVRAALPEGGRYTVRTNPDFGSGMAGSLIVGIDALQEMQPDGGHWLAGAAVLLADQPMVTAALVDLLLREARSAPKAILAIAYAGQRSTPVYFPRSLFGELRQITGDEGGRSVIARHAEQVRMLNIDQPELGLDVDSSGEYQNLLANWSQYAPLRWSSADRR